MIVVSSPYEAAKIQERLKTGAVVVLAREQSVDATAVDGGFMGDVDPGNLRPELRTALEGLQPGSVSQTVKIPSGYAILKALPASEVADLAEDERVRQFAASAERSIHFTFDISGNNEAEAALAGFHKPEGWNLDLASACEMRKQSYAAIVARAEALISEAKDAPDAMSARVARGQLHAYRGEMDCAVEQWEIAYARAQKDLPRALPYLDQLLGIGYLLRLSNNFGTLNRRFAPRMGPDLALLSVTFDPVHDTPKVLAAYAATWKADPKSWHFLTGTLPEVQAVCRRFGLNFWQEEGLFTHSLQTFVVDRAGKLASNFEGNEFSAGQLGDFVLSLMAQ